MNGGRLSQQPFDFAPTGRLRIRNVEAPVVADGGAEPAPKDSGESQPDRPGEPAHSMMVGVDELPACLDVKGSYPAAPNGMHPPAHTIARLEDIHLCALKRKCPGSREAGQAGARDQHADATEQTGR
jgi:hypothetical protein